MSWEGVAAMLVAVGGALGALFTGYRNLRGDQFRREVDESAALLSGYKEMAAALRTELEAMRTTLHQERQQWVVERRALHDEIDTEREEREVERQALRREINELRTQVARLERQVNS